MSQRPPSGAAVLQPDVTAAIVAAVISELVERGYARLSMEGVAKRAGTSKSALYRRWPGKQDMVLAVLADISVPMSDVVETGDLRKDMRASAESLAAWLAAEPYAKIIPDLIAEAHRTPELATAMEHELQLFVSDVVLGSLEPATVTDPRSHTYLPDLAALAWDQGLPRHYIPICAADNGYYCIADEGQVYFWDTSGPSEDEWGSIWHWAREVWLNS